MPANPVWSAELLAKFDQLTTRQAAAIPRLVAHLARGDSLNSLLNGPDKVCAEQTYYGRPAGWAHQPLFQEALRQAQQEYRQALAGDAIATVHERLYAAAPDAIKRTIEIMQQGTNLAQARLAARDLLREIMKQAAAIDGDHAERNELAITFQSPDWARPEEPPDGDPGH